MLRFGMRNIRYARLARQAVRPGLPRLTDRRVSSA